MDQAGGAVQGSLNNSAMMNSPVMLWHSSLLEGGTRSHELVVLLALKTFKWS